MVKKRSEPKGASINLKQELMHIAIVIAIMVVVVLLGIFVLLVVLTREAGGEVVYPESPLTKMMDQPYSYIADETLDITIECPEIPVRLNVGGIERYVADHGCVFRYDDSFSISVYELETSAFELLSGEFAVNLYNGDMSGIADYIPDVSRMDVGYFNGFPAEYQCGVIDVSDEQGVVYRNIYVMSMVIDLGLEKNLFIAISTNDKKKLYEGELLLESVGYTIVDTSITRNSVQRDSDDSLALGGGVDVILESEIEVAEENTEKELLSQNSTIAANKGSGLTHIDVEIPLLTNYEEGVVVVLQYTNLEADVSGLEIRGEESGVVSGLDPASKKGIAFFGLSEGRKGNYSLRIPAETDLGTYSARIMGYSDFSSEYTEVPLSGFGDLGN